jgi:uncharacterized membrane protein YhaH (DUF805 family)
MENIEAINVDFTTVDTYYDTRNDWFLKIFFSPKWRIWRKQFFLYSLFWSFIVMLFSYLFTRYFFNINIIVWDIIILIFMVILNIKRIHDLDKSAWFIFIYFIPVVWFLFYFYLLFFQWTKWNNKFWPSK